MAANEESLRDKIVKWKSLIRVGSKRFEDEYRKNESNVQLHER